MSTNDTKLEILHDHFKETFSIIRRREGQRDSLFIKLVIIFTIIVFEIQYPVNLGGAINKIQIFGSDIDLTKLPLAPLLNATWILCLVIALRYAQSTSIIERQYNYLHKLEEKISDIFKDKELYCREGKSYFQSYPLFHDWVWFCYTILFPLTVITAVVTLLVIEWQDFIYASVIHKIFDSIIAISIIISFALYKTIPQILNKFKKDNG